jgi:alkylation response protein AidB-like acyl-CoA dehydrogenase
MAGFDIELGLTDEDREIRDTVHKFAQEVLRPAGRELDRLVDPAQVIAPDSVLWDVFKKYYTLDIHRMMYDAEMEPVAKARLMAIVNEEMSWGDVGLAITLGLSGFHIPFVQQSGDQELIERFCSFDNPTIGCWALTEPDHGGDSVGFTEKHFSDPALKANCVARKDGDDYVINGQKAAWVSNGSIAHMAVLFCTLDTTQGFKGGAVFVVPMDLPGITRPRPLDKLGQRSLNQGEIYFENVRVPKRYCVIEPNAYAITLEIMLSHGNTGMAQLFVGPAQAALDHAVAYAKERIQGGVPIFSHQSVKSRLFKMFAKVEAARSIARRVAMYNATNLPKFQYCVAAKTFVTQSAFEVASDAVQIYGGNGLSREYPVEKLLRDARASLVEDGCNEMLGIMAGSRL